MYLKMYTPGLRGKLRLIPLPKFDAADAPTATWGGTMFGIPRNCRDPDAAWKLMETLLLTEEAAASRRRHTSVLAPMVEQWNDPRYDEPDPFFGEQKVMALYVELARQVPERYVTPFTTIAQSQLTVVLAKAMDAIDAGQDEDELESLCRAWLHEAAKDLERRVEFGRFD
jgi:ABC-type glycerol-3-phosphate transport system substrate-binding protein